MQWKIPKLITVTVSDESRELVGRRDVWRGQRGFIVYGLLMGRVVKRMAARAGGLDITVP